MRGTCALVVSGMLVAQVAGCGGGRDESVELEGSGDCRTARYAAPAWRSPESHAGAVRSICMSDATAAMLAPISDEAKRLGIDVVHDGGCDLEIEVTIGDAATVNAAGMPPDWRAHPDGFAWSTRLDGRTRHVTVLANDARGAHYAMHALIAAANGADGAIAAAGADWPAFPVRGVIEGFYNRYFTRDQRATTLRLMHELRENRYLYAPKDDRYAGYRWRDPYPADAAADLKAAAALAAQLHIDFVFGISPTLSANGENPAASIRFSSSEDFTALLSKLEAVKALGVSRFALFYDDTSHQLYHAEDRAAFATLAAAHADLANRLAAALGGPLLIVGDYYSSQFGGWESYNAELGGKLASAVDVLWTGPAVFSRTIAPADLTKVNELLGRQVVLWDNWPTAAQPVTGRAAQLFTATSAILTNATLVGDFSHPVADFWRVLPSLAQYAWSPTSYVAEAAYGDGQAMLPGMLACAK